MSDIKEIREIKEKVDEIHIVIAGNPKYGQKGIKDHFEELDKRVEKLEDQNKKMEEDKKKEWKRTVKAGLIGGAAGGSIGALAPKTVIAKIISFFSL